MPKPFKKFNFYQLLPKTVPKTSIVANKLLLLSGVNNKKTFFLKKTTIDKNSDMVYKKIAKVDFWEYDRFKSLENSKSVSSYRYTRYVSGFPANGQRTCSNAKTAKKINPKLYTKKVSK